MDWGISILCGFAGGLIGYAGIARKLWNLQCDLSATKAQLLKERNARAANTRWRDQEALEELQAAAGAQPSSKLPIRPDPLAKFKRV